MSNFENWLPGGGPIFLTPDEKAVIRRYAIVCQLISEGNRGFPVSNMTWGRVMRRVGWRANSRARLSGGQHQAAGLSRNAAGMSRLKNNRAGER